MKPRQAQAGFTLIEIMVVVFILGLLVTLVAPKIIGKTDTARATKAAADIKGIETALQMFKLDCGFYPSTGQGLEALVASGGGGGGSACRKYSPEGYLDKVPVDPWGNRYAYFSDGQNIIIKS
ncbi:MAG TPA: type II secretion system major pseudopilin GspG, partial [Candidatus Kryptonia bacterium]|nr:type II secretion system major pseudopilin GspG [Candidatus Kryptonia bacterium]